MFDDASEVVIESIVIHLLIRNKKEISNAFCYHLHFVSTDSMRNCNVHRVIKILYWLLPFFNFYLVSGCGSENGFIWSD